MLEIGYKDSFEIRKELLFANCNSSIQILYLSDLHLNKYSESLVHNIIEKISQINPDIVLLGGDYIDFESGISFLKRLCYFLSDQAHVYAIPGNHDSFFGVKKVEAIFDHYKIKWLPKSSSIVQLNGIKIYINADPKIPTLKEADFNILCLHQPIDVSIKMKTVNLILAGHLHGCQINLWQNEKGIYPGKLFYKWNLLRQKLQHGVYLISKGLGDSLPIRFNCKRDMLLITLTNQTNP